jgi:hypothetical protein
MQPVIRLAILALGGLMAVSSPGLAQSRTPDLTSLSIEDLMSFIAFVFSQASNSCQPSGPSREARALGRWAEPWSGPSQSTI